MKALSIILTLALLGVMGWLVVDSRSEAKGAKNQLDLLRRQQTGKGAAGTDDKQVVATESQLMAAQASNTPPPSVASIPAPKPLPASVTAPPSNSTVGRTPVITSALQAANAAPPQPTQRQRLIASVPKLAEVKEYEKDYGFVVITAGASQKLEVGQGFAIRRDKAIIARVKVTEVEPEGAVASVDSRSVPPGVLIEPGDEIIQDLPPES